MNKEEEGDAHLSMGALLAVPPLLSFCGYGILEEKSFVCLFHFLNVPFACIRLRHSMGDEADVMTTLGSLSLAHETPWEM